MRTERGQSFQDVKSRQLFGPAHLKDLEGPVGPSELLALWFFLSQHADPRVCIVVHRGCHDEEDERWRD